MNQFIDLELNRPASAAFLAATWPGLAIFIMSLAGAAILIHVYQQDRRDYQAIAQSINQQHPTKKIVHKSPLILVSGTQIKQVNGLINLLATPWDGLFHAVEQSDLPNIALLSIEPNLKKQQLVLTGEAKNLPMVLRYIQQLESQAILNEVYLQKHSIDEADVSKPVRFSVLAKWEIGQK